MVLGNIWDRIIGFAGTLKDLEKDVDPKGGLTTVAERSFIGAIIKYLKTLFNYGNLREKDEDPIYNGTFRKPDIDTYDKGTDGLKSGTLEGSVLYNRVENTIEYFSTKTKFMFEEMDTMKQSIVTLTSGLTGLQENVSKGQEENEKKQESTGNDISDIKDSLKDIGDAIKLLQAGVKGVEGRVAGLEKDMSAQQKKYPV
jgi:prefoldin subunit 5